MRNRWLVAGVMMLVTAVACSSSDPGQITPGAATENPASLAPTPTPPAVPTATATAVPFAQWISVAPMNIGRTAYSATVLSDGRVMVVGGLGAAGILRSVEIYDPEADSWTIAADTIHPRRKAITETLADGRVLVSGGQVQQTVATAEIFDPVIGQWTEIPPMTVGRESAMAVPLNDGRLLVFGGGNGIIGGADGQFELNSAEIFDPERNEWTLTEPIAQAEMSWEGWVKLNDGRVLLAGGDFARPNRFVQIFEPETDTWELGAELPQPTGGGAATLLPNGDVLLAGGGLRCCLRESLVYGVGSGEWRPGPEMLVERGGHTGLNLPDGRIAFLFGLNPELPFDQPHRSGELYDPETGTWELIPDFPGVFDMVNQVLVLPDGSIMQVGGRSAEFDTIDTVNVTYSTEAFLLTMLPK